MMWKDRVVIMKWKKISLVVPEKEDIVLWYTWLNPLDNSIPLGRADKIDLFEKKEEIYDNLLKNPEKIFFSIMDNETSSIVWYIKYNEISHFHKKAYFSLTIFSKETKWKWYWTESILLFLDYSFRIQWLRKVNLRYYDFNAVWAHIYKKIGFKEVWVLKKDTYINWEFRDRIIMEIFKEEFYEKNKEYFK